MEGSGSDSSVCDPASMVEPGQRIEPLLARVLDDRALPANLREAARYAVLGPGKRLRPTLVIRSCEAVGATAKQLEQALVPAAAIEMIHCFSLVHDDLPAMDDDDLRRGRPTLHKQTNEAMAILAGDLLAVLPFELIATRVAPASLARDLGRELAEATNDMIAGQAYDTVPDSGTDAEPIERLRTIHRHKTAALIRGSCRMGALCGDADQAQLQAVTRFGEAIGLMFQIVDDLLDVTQSTEQLGKMAGKDEQQGKLTYPGLLDIERSQEEVTRLHEEALSALVSLGDGAEPLVRLTNYMAVRTK